MSSSYLNHKATQPNYRASQDNRSHEPIMKKTYWDAATVAELHSRVDRLLPTSRASWGKMNPAQAMKHVTIAMQSALGETTVQPVSSIFAYTPFKQLVIYAIPWPNNAKTVPEADSPPHGDLVQEKADLLAVMERFAKAGIGFSFAPHPMFRGLSGKAWGVWAYRHLDHHLRQFGV